ncbi:MAG: ATP synthase F1 subunit delta [Oscillospiraceae bacterium]|nr:ATP synthase F1 subunit delta [Oscillospiraceae bacterium]
MNEKAEKVYGESFFELCLEESADRLKDTAAELDALSAIFAENPEFAKVMDTPTISVEEKVSLIKDIITDGNVSEYTGNLLCVLAERGRFSCWNGIVKHFRAKYNEHFRIAEIIVTASAPLTEDMRAKITAKMSEITGKSITICEKVDPAIIGGVIIDYGSTRYDGSVRARLNALKNELGSIIA